MGLVLVGFALVVLGLVLTFSDVLGFAIGIPLVAVGVLLVLVGVVFAVIGLAGRAVRAARRA